MLGREPRVLLFAAAALDQVGQLLLIAALTASSSFLAIPSIEEISNHQIDWILFYSFVTRLWVGLNIFAMAKIIYRS